MSSLRSIVHSISMFLIGVYIGANLTQLQTLNTETTTIATTTTSKSSSSNLFDMTTTMLLKDNDNNNQRFTNRTVQLSQQQQRPLVRSDTSSTTTTTTTSNDENGNPQSSSLKQSFRQCLANLRVMQQRFDDCQSRSGNVDGGGEDIARTTTARLSAASSSSSSQPLLVSNVENNQNDQQQQRQRHPVCRHISLLPSLSSQKQQQQQDDDDDNNDVYIPTAMSIWSAHLEQIHKASQLLPNDRRYALSDYTAELLHLVSNRLPRAIKTVPHRWDSIERVLTVAYQRWNYIQQLKSKTKAEAAAEAGATAEQTDNTQQQQRRQRRKRRQVQHGRVLSSREQDEEASATTTTSSGASSPIPRKLNILIMGGSLLVGTNCRKIIPDVGIPGVQMPNRHCTWSNRVEQFLNRLLVGSIIDDDPKVNNDADSIYDLVHVTKTAMGGTNTETGQVILEYDLLPEDAREFDIVINAYSTNDMHILTVLDAAQGNVTLRDKVFDMVQGFVRQVLGQRRRHHHHQQQCTDNATQGTHDDDRHHYHHPSRDVAVPPLLLHMDDYLGNEQREIWATTELSQGVQVLANYYGFASMSYADVVRDLVYGDTHESWFSPSGWYDNNKASDDTTMKREIHPGMGMHITATWVTAFTLLHLVTTYCSLEWSLAGNSSLAYWHDDHVPLNYERLMGLPPLKGLYVVPGKPQRPPRDLLPPPLTKELSLENVTRLWREQEQQSTSSSLSSLVSCQDNHHKRVRCPFSWVSGLNQQQNNVTYVNEYFAKRTISNVGWNLEKSHNKLGFVPTSSLISSTTSISTAGISNQSNNSMILEFQDLHQTIRTISLFIMKSYGPEWANSRLQVRIFQANKLLLSQVLEGFHDKQTSEMYTELLQLHQQNAKNSSSSSSSTSLRIQMDLVEGATFKIMGLAVCS